MIYYARLYLTGKKRPDIPNVLMVNLPTGNKNDARKLFLSYIKTELKAPPERMHEIGMDVYDQNTYTSRLVRKEFREGAKKGRDDFKKQWPIGVVYSATYDL